MSVSQTLSYHDTKTISRHRENASPTFSVMHVYEIRLRKDKRGVDLISDVLPFGHLWYGEPNAVRNAIGYAMHSSRSHDAVIGVLRCQMAT
jgi:hypothetical protein